MSHDKRADKKHEPGRGAVGSHVERTPEAGMKKSPKDAPSELGDSGADERAMGVPMGDRDQGQYTDAGRPGLQKK